MKTHIDTKWNNNLAYAIGLIATDGNLSPDERHINLTSKDGGLIKNFKSCLGISNKIGMKGSGSNKTKKYHVVQFSNVYFYRFLNKIGITKSKSKTISKLKIPHKYFFDFLRGCIDGDGCITSTKHPESKLLQLRIRLCSASKPFLVWVKEVIGIRLKIQSGWIYTNKNASMHTLSYGKTDSVKIIQNMYYDNVTYYLKRKYKIARKFTAK